MSLLKMAASIFMNKVSGGQGGGGLSLETIMPALQSLLPTKDGDLDLGSLVNKFGASGLTNMAASFLGNGENDSFAPTQLLSMLGDNKVAEFAGKLGIEKETAASGLSSMIPDLLDQQSSEGSLASSGLGKAASSMLGGLFK